MYPKEKRRGNMKTKNRFWMAVWLFIFLTACKGKPEFINHEQPNLTVSSDAFNDVETVAALGCHEISAPSDLIGGLNPSYPIAICLVQYIPGEGSEELKSEIDSGQFFYYTGGLGGSYLRYIIQQD